MGIHVWYNSATDVTGKALADALTAKGIEVSHSTSKPRNKPDLLLCYGCKKEEGFTATTLRGWNVLNDPIKIRDNANKLASLGKLKSGRVSVATPIVEASSIDRALSQSGSDSLSFPIVGRTKFHQGGKGFWLCLQKDDVQNAIAGGAQYFQPYIPKSEEYRVHVFNGAALFTVKKVKRSDPYDEWRNDRREVITEKAAERNVTIDRATLDLALEFAPKRIKLPDAAIRSIHRGWVFKSVTGPKTSIVELAIKTAEILGLDFAAVDIMVGDDGTSYVLEANSGPGLKGQNIEKYVNAIEARHTEIVSAARRASIVPSRPSSPARTSPRPARREPTSDRVRTTEGSGNLPSSVRGLLRGVNVDDLNAEGKQAIKTVLGNVLDSELGL